MKFALVKNIWNGPFFKDVYFSDHVVNYFERENIVDGKMYFQTLDGIDCFMPDAERFWFLKFRLDRMVRRGILEKTKINSIWKSRRGIPAYKVKNND